jgi:predicted transcriptional regulator
MLISEIRDLLSSDVYAGDDILGTHVDFGCASDLMSDVLAFSRAGAVLLTGLMNIQTIHTSFIAEIRAIVFVRGKRPDKEMIALANEKKIPLLGTPYSMYEACGILYRKGLVSTMEYDPRNASCAGGGRI